MTDTKQAEKHADFPELIEKIDQLREICTKMYCIENNLDLDEASDYAKASVAVSKYRVPFTRDEAWLIENQQYSCSCMVSEYALEDVWSELIDSGNDYFEKIKGAMERAEEWLGKEITSLKECDYSTAAEEVKSRIIEFLTNCEKGNCYKKAMEYNQEIGKESVSKDNCAKDAAKIMEWMKPHAIDNKIPRAALCKQDSLYSNSSGSIVPSADNVYDVQVSENKIASLYDVLRELETHFYSWKNIRDRIWSAGENIIQSGKERITQFIDERKRAAILRDEEAIKGAMEKVRTIISDLRNGEYKKSRWYDTLAATCPNPWSDTSVTLLNPIKFFGYCNPVRECILYHEYQHHHQYEMWRQSNPKAPVGRYLNEVVLIEIQAYEATQLCLDAKLKEIEMMRRKGEI